MAPARETILVANPIGAAGSSVIASPFQFLVTGEDNLRVRMWNSAGGAALVLTGRMKLASGELQALTYTFTPAATRSEVDYLVALGSGFILNLTVENVAGTVRGGQCFVVLELVRGFSGGLQTLGTVAAGYVATNVPLAWPGSPVRTSIEGPGYVRHIAATSPAAGVELFETCPIGARWQVHEFYGVLTTSAAVANRRVTLRAADAIGRQRFVSPSAYTQTASQSVLYTWMPGLPHETTVLVGSSTMGLPWPHVLQAGLFLATSTNSFDAADRWSAAAYVVEEWIDIWGP